MSSTFETPSGPLAASADVDSQNQTAPEEQKPETRPKLLARRRLYNPSRHDYEPLRVFGYVFNMEELVVWREKHDPQANLVYRHDSFPTLREIDRRLLGKTSLHVTWAAVKHPIDKEVAYCFSIGSNRNQAGLENARNWQKVRKFQSVLGIEKDVMPQWYRVVDL